MIDGQFLKDAVVDIGKSAVGLSIAHAINLPQKLNFGDSLIARNVSIGAISFVTSDAIDAVLTQGEQSKLLKGDLVGALDETLFFSAVSGAVDVSGVANMIYSTYSSTLGLSREYTATATDASILAASRIASRYIEAQSIVPDYIKSLRYPVKTVMGN